jgi:hypothetical protein
VILGAPTTAEFEKWDLALFAQRVKPKIFISMLVRHVEIGERDRAFDLATYFILELRI